jgi:segregation and condensation protein B
MSVKAKIEAVIYAADEPVTLAQLAAIFGDELLDALAESDLPFDAEEDANQTVPVEPDAPAVEPDTREQAAQPGSGQPVLPMDDAETKKRARAREREARAAVESIVRELIAEYSSSDRGMEVREIAGGYRIATKAEYHDAVRAFVKGMKPPMKLSLQALETLAVVAYKQPVTAPEISEIRGVDTSGVLGGLIARKLITTAGRKQVIGRPILYKTTKEFLLRFGLKDLSELPSIEEFEKMAAQMSEDMTQEAAEDAAADAAASEAEPTEGASSPAGSPGNPADDSSTGAETSAE